jgi:hypothetical protein
MVGGERERKGKGKVAKPKFNDCKKPKPRVTKAELKAIALKNEGFGMLSGRASVFKFCPKDGKRLDGKYMTCSKCLESWSSKHLSEAGPFLNAHLIDTRDYLKFWRKKLYWRLTFTYHSGVRFSTDPPNPFSVFESAFVADWQDAA